MDRERLKEVRQTDITESRVNEDFVDWLKNKAPSWLLAILLVACGYLVVVKWRQGQLVHRVDAWSAYGEAQQSGLPPSFEDVAERYGDVDGLGVLGRLRSAQRLLAAVQANAPFDAEPGQVATLDAEQRENYLSRAEAQFANVVEMTKDGTSIAQSLFALNALDGQAAVAEARGDVARAAELYRLAAARAEPDYPELAVQARARADALAPLATALAFPTEEQVRNARPTFPSMDPAVIEAPLTDLLLPAETSGN